MNFRAFQSVRVMFYFLAIAGAMMAPLPGRGDDEVKSPEYKSPDKRFVFRKLKDEAGYGIVERKSGRTVVVGDNEEGFVGVGDSPVAAVWEAGGAKFAVNYRAGGRYNTTQLFVWTGKKFAELASVEDLLNKVVEKERAAFLKKEKVPADRSLRRIWDAYRTLRWVDDRTVEVYVESTRTFLRNEGDEDPEDLTIGGVFTVRFDKKGKPQVIGRREPTKKESGAD